MALRFLLVFRNVHPGWSCLRMVSPSVIEGMGYPLVYHLACLETMSYTRPNGSFLS